ncbi:MAG: hypothetical protein Q8L80_06860 [Gallionella sp.]|nr:hypothetical protein [Gallionella sp.]
MTNNNLESRLLALEHGQTDAGMELPPSLVIARRFSFVGRCPEKLP